MRQAYNIVTTLLDNAVKFTPEGGAIGVKVRCAANADVVRLMVWDTGIGMTAEAVAVLFWPFSQADQGLTRQFAGTGTGLAYVSKMVEILGGAIAVKSAPGAGSRFIVTLPTNSRPGNCAASA
jgi:signal transduction histidine kinase